MGRACVQAFNRQTSARPWHFLRSLFFVLLTRSLVSQVGVHIADVSYFVRHDSLLDLEARARGTTVYLVDRRFDMLPKLLAEDLCSLVGGQDRLAVSVVWHVDPSGPSIVGRPWFGRTVIHNRHQLSYPQVGT